VGELFGENALRVTGSLWTRRERPLGTRDPGGRFVGQTSPSSRRGVRLLLRLQCAAHFRAFVWGDCPMFDYLRIMLNARLAKMDERGASAVEYGLLIAGIAALIIVVVFAFGGVLNKIFDSTCDGVGASAGTNC
jgi:pilus assembly protein Flp/PilA